MSPQERVGKNIRSLRVERGLSQEALAHICDLHPTEISRLERGVREPRLGTIVAIADGLEVEPAALLANV